MTVIIAVQDGEISLDTPALSAQTLIVVNNMVLGQFKQILGPHPRELYEYPIEREILAFHAVMILCLNLYFCATSKGTVRRRRGDGVPLSDGK